MAERSAWAPRMEICVSGARLCVGHPAIQGQRRGEGSSQLASHMHTPAYYCMWMCASVERVVVVESLSASWAA